MSHTLTPPASSDDTDVLDAEWLAAPARRSRSRLLLIAVLAVLVVFLAGVQVEKRWGTDSSSGSGQASRFPGAAAFAGSSGTSPFGGGFTAGGTGSTSAGASSPGSTDPGSTSVGSSTGASASASTPAVIGTLTAVHGDSWIVRDLGGKSHTVRLTDRTTLTRPVADARKPVRAGAPITVTGTTHGTTVTATAVTLR